MLPATSTALRLASHALLLLPDGQWLAGPVPYLDCFRRILRAAQIRLRPVLMTTAAMVFGLVPLLFASGAGAASRFGLGVVIVSGMLVGTLFTLFVLPTVYTLLARNHAEVDKSPRSRQLAEADLLVNKA